ncbi:hypothetical protein RYH80_10450 [Halobaculum sp. MBLA0147]|uniref:hypothetical protein n=1 Tax=Halobaculum sp. MBLA0147 TaxID=3079934 RepID=UPI003524958D
MRAEITGEGEQVVGVSVIDHADVEHLIDLDRTGEITGYKQDGYSKGPSGYTHADRIRIERAQYYARYYVQRERGYPTFERRSTPEWLAHVVGAVFLLDVETFEHHFGACRRQYNSVVCPTVDPVVDGPYHDAGGGLVVRADLFTGLDFESYLDDPRAFDPSDIVGGVTDHYDVLEGLSERVETHLDGRDPILEVSTPDVFYQTREETGVEEATAGERTHARDEPTDARLQLLPPEVTLDEPLSAGVFQGMVLHHLTCQVRDAYLRLGVEPPDPFRVLGHGLFRQTIRYQHTEFYDRYDLTDAEIDGYRAPGTAGDVSDEWLSGVGPLDRVRRRTGSGHSER